MSKYYFQYYLKKAVAQFQLKTHLISEERYKARLDKYRIIYTKYKYTTFPNANSQINKWGGIDFFNVEEIFINEGCTLSNLNKIKNFNRKNSFLLISHELSMTGAPIALLNAAMCLISEGYNVLILSPKNGPLYKIISDKKIPVCVYPGLITQFNQNYTDLIVNICNLFNLVLCNTLCAAPSVLELSKTKTKVIWWLHEADESYTSIYVHCLPKSLPKNIYVFTVSSYADTVLHKYRDYNTARLTYTLSDTFLEFKKVKNNKIKFACVGTIQKRKGQDCLFKAIKKLSKDLIKRCEFIFVGNNRDNKIYSLLNDNKDDYNIKLIDEIPYNRMIEFYQDIDCIICSSIDDPYPITATESCLYKIPLIYSDKIGIAKELHSYKIGLSVKCDSNYIENLANSIENLIINFEKSETLTLNSRKFFVDNFSNKKFISQINNVLSSPLT